jgi:hypothetical protein
MGFEFAALAVKIGADIRDLEKGLATASGDLKRFSKDNSEVIKTFGAQFLATGIAITGTLAMMVKSTTAYSDQIFIAHQRTGIATETLSSLKYVAEQTESSFEDLTIGLKSLGRNMAEASQGNAALILSFRTLGTSFKDAEGNIKPVDRMLLDMADKFARMEDGAEKTSLAIQIFGRSGTSMIPMLNLGSKGIKELLDESEKLGRNLKEKDAVAFDNFTDTVNKLKTSVGGLFQTLVIQFLPGLTSLANSISMTINGFRTWAEANPTLSKGILTVTGVVGGLTTAIGTLLLVLGPLAVSFNALVTAGIITKLVAGVQLLTAGFIGLAGAIGLVPFTLLAVGIASIIKSTTQWISLLGQLREAQDAANAAMKTLDESFSKWNNLAEKARGAWNNLTEAEQAQITRLEYLIKVYDDYLKQGAKDINVKKDLQKAIENQGIAIGKIIQAHKDEIKAKDDDIAKSIEYEKTLSGIQSQINELTLSDTALKKAQHEEKLKMMRAEIESTKMVADERIALLKKVDEYEEAYNASTKAGGGALDDWNARVEGLGEGFLKIEGDATAVFGNMSSIFTDTALTFRSSLGSVLGDAFTGKLKSAGEYFKSFCQSMAQNFASMIANMVSQYLWGKAVGLALNFLGSTGGSTASSVGSTQGLTVLGTSTSTANTSLAGQAASSMGSASSSGLAGSASSSIIRSSADGMWNVPQTGIYQLHQGEEVTPKYQKEEGITVITIIDEKLIPAIMAKYPSAIINAVNENIVAQGSVKKTIQKEIK